MLFVIFGLFMFFGISFVWICEVIHDRFERKRRRDSIEDLNHRFGYTDTDDRK